VRGRGTGYSRARGAWEAILRTAYAGDWPARAWARVPRATEVARVRHSVACLATGARPVRLAYASDLHIGPTTPEAILENATEILAEARPDLLLLGGDYVFMDATARTAERLERFVREVAAPRTFAVLGNHDLWTDHPRLEAALERAGATVLVNDVEGVHDVVIVGIDDPWTGAPDPESVLSRAGEGTRVVLVHSPDAVAWVAGRADVLVCGHTHGGQIALPGGVPVVVPGEGSRRWPHGRFEVEGTTVLVSRGLGGIELPIRAFAQPDVMIVDLVARHG
jgi:predicted MPP superfamily phosphohydrolase